MGNGRSTIPGQNGGIDKSICGITDPDRGHPICEMFGIPGMYGFPNRSPKDDWLREQFRKYLLPATFLHQLSVYGAARVGGLLSRPRTLCEPCMGWSESSICAPPLRPCTESWCQKVAGSKHAVISFVGLRTSSNCVHSWNSKHFTDLGFPVGMRDPAHFFCEFGDFAWEMGEARSQAKMVELTKAYAGSRIPIGNTKSVKCAEFQECTDFQTDHPRMMGCENNSGNICYQLPSCTSSPCTEQLEWADCFRDKVVPCRNKDSTNPLIQLI